MLGREIADPDGIEGKPGSVPGLGLLDLTTTMTPDKRVTETEALHPASNTKVKGYEIHLGRTEGPDRACPLFTVSGQPEGAIREDGRVMGSYLHGMFTEDAFRRAFLAGLGATPSNVSYDRTVEETLDALAEHLAAHVDCAALLRLAEVDDL
jgi:adenosylcobyric acid synthase